MPELPEVETVVRSIRPRLEGRAVASALVHWRRTVGSRAFEENVVGARIVRVRRRAKYIVIDLERERREAGAIVGHLRMTGRIHVEERAFDPGPYKKVELGLDDGRVLHFIDVRKFGRFEFAADPALALAELGPEPLSDEFSAEWLHAALRARKRALKPLLLDQTFLAGLGNIYVDESLHRAGLHPLARSERLKAADCGRLVAEIRRVLSDAIVREGSSFDAFYRTPEGNPGSYQDEFQVYGRGGEACRTCGTEIRRIVVGQRGTHFCPKCQPRSSARQEPRRSSLRAKARASARASATARRALPAGSTAARRATGRA
jgi:formamidopyrimidine-DNA glycosylase